MDVSDLLGPSILTYFTENGQAISFRDIDGDGWDDLSIARGSDAPLFLLNQGGTFAPAPFNIPNVPAGNINMLLWADHDNDGDLDLFLTKQSGGMQLWRNDGSWAFTQVTQAAGLEVANLHYFGAAFCDYDHDGWLDLYVTKYYSSSGVTDTIYSSLLYRNNGDGTFTDVTLAAGVFLEPHNAFQPVFLDYDNDGWEDLFLVVDRIIHTNELFRNNGDGTFTNVTTPSNMGLTICSMTGTIGDPDHDGDLDVFISNNPPIGQKYMRNEGDGTFTDATEQAGLAIAISGWGGLWLDHDNDTWEDLFMGSTHGIPPYPGNLFYRNQMGNGFIMDNAALGPGGDLVETYVCSMGDLDNDGYYDIMLNNRPPQTSKLYRNAGGTNHWFAFTLQGTFSNRDGIGTWVHCYAGGQHLVRFTTCGADLTNQSSHRIIFGLGQHTTIDSLVIEWNRGTRDVYHGLAVDQHLHFMEGASLLGPVVITNLGPALLCTGGSTMLDAGEGYVGYLWNTGHQERFLEVTAAGTYQVTITDTLGFVRTSQPVDIGDAPPNIVTSQVQHISCHGAMDGAISLSFSIGPPETVTWSHGATGSTLTGLAGGGYSYTVVDTFGCTEIGGAFINEPAPLLLDISTVDAPEAGGSGSATLDITGGTPPHSIAWSTGQNDLLNVDGIPIGQHSVAVTDANDCHETLPFAIGVATSIWEHEAQQGPFAFPNPAGLELWLGNLPPGPQHLRLTDLRGRVLNEWPMHPGTMPLSLQGLGNGCYLLQVWLHENWWGMPFLKAEP